MDGHEVRIYDKDRLICDCLRYRSKMDKEIFNKAIQRYVAAFLSRWSTLTLCM